MTKQENDEGASGFQCQPDVEDLAGDLAEVLLAGELTSTGALSLPLRVSGSYERKKTGAASAAAYDSDLGGEDSPEDDQGARQDESSTERGFLLPSPWSFDSEELRLDVDGMYPQMTASGTLQGFLLRVHWIAKLKKSAVNTWQGSIWYKNGSAFALPYTNVTVKATPSLFAHQRKATVVFSGGGVSPRSAVYAFKSGYFRSVTIEYDCAAGTTAVTSVKTHDHPNRPASLPSETLSIETVFRRAGFQVTRSGDTVVPIGLAGGDSRWSDNEMHDAMQAHWSRFANKPQWALWTFFASLHKDGTSLGGVMFDDIGPNHRQGTAIFNDSFISKAPAGEAHAAAWVRRMRFWTAVHEMGHSFNLAHSWQKSHPPSWGTPWIPLANEPEARSFMNYPYNVSGGQSAFFSSFAYRFSNAELLFMRHAPERFVQMGNANWFDNHGFQEGGSEGEPSFRLEVRVNRERPVFEFLEPIVVELKLTNVSDRAQVVDEDILSGDHETTVILKKEGRPAREWVPYARYCREPRVVALPPGESLYGSLFVSAGLNGWDVSEPGRYVVQVAVEHGERRIVSRELELRILPAHGFEEERLAQDFFSNEVGRTLAFDGTRYFEAANDTLREVVERLPDRPVACHARVALGSPAMQPYKRLDLDAKEPQVKLEKVSLKGATSELKEALIRNSAAAAETLGHIDYKHYVDRYSAFLAERSDPQAAAECQNVMHSTLSMRKVLPRVLRDIENALGRFQTTREKAGKA